MLKGRVSYYNEEVCANSCTVILIEKIILPLTSHVNVATITCFRMRSCWRRRYESEAAGGGSSSLAESGSSSSSLRRGFVFFRGQLEGLRVLGDQQQGDYWLLEDPRQQMPAQMKRCWKPPFGVWTVDKGRRRVRRIMLNDFGFGCVLCLVSCVLE